MNNIYINDCSFDDKGEYGQVFEIFPDIFGDSRGFFTEVYRKTKKIYHCPRIMLNGISWIQQVNRSASRSFVMRGMHAQVGESCQSKLVESINRVIFDIIVDARPDSKTFGVSKFYKLDPEKQNKVFIPKGFLHGFIVPGGSNEKAYFNYYCDNCYDNDNEICISPKTYLPGISNVISEIQHNHEFDQISGILNKSETLVFSNKDISGLSYKRFMETVYTMYKDGKLWYESGINKKDILDKYSVI